MLEDVAVVGWACRLPGARSIDKLWSLVRNGRCSITQVPANRFPQERFGHPRRQERGRSYTWAAGVLDNIWDFDPGVFGISPREAIQMDPQQRILLQLTWEALEDAGIPPSSIAGTEVGVYVGACQVEYGHRFGIDHAVADSHFATGTALSVVSNRISYVFDLHGPSMTIDTACSSSMVALHEAVEALRAGRIDTAIVGGVNIIESPSSFIAFSQASMLSPTGSCRAFSANADGFVRAEGAGILVLRHTGRTDSSQCPVHGYIVATATNSDGRTSGISLPSLEGQMSLLDRIYRGADIDPKHLAFVEAHGTGTPVGDPIEATALGRTLGVSRDPSSPLLIGSIKTNIGHVEAAAGMAGLFKAFLALNHRQLPPSLQFSEPSPHIEFEKLNLAVCNALTPLPQIAGQVAGVNSFGFGGTNAHAIIAPGKKSARHTIAAVRPRSLFMISAETKPALAQLAADYAHRVAGLSDREISVLGSAAIHRREHLAERAVVTGGGSEAVMRALEACASGAVDPHLVSGHAVGKNLPVALVYSGNGSQWAGMGRAAFRQGSKFSAHFDALDSYFIPLAGWSLRDMLFSGELEEKLVLTSVAQPLLFAIQSAATVELRSRGLSPVAIIGHSVGEVAAAEAAGIIDAKTAVKLVYVRSMYQDRARGMGRMMAMRVSVDAVEDMVAKVAGVEIAANNSPRSVTVAGTTESLAALAKAYPRVAMIDLGLDYPFHTHLMESIRDRMAVDLECIVPRESTTPFISTVTGALMPGAELDGAYWWRNVRQPVKFAAATLAAAALGARVFIEIGARPTLLQHVNDIFEADTTVVATVPVFEREDDGSNPFEKTVARAVVCGAQVDLSANFGPDPGPAVRLPFYPWQQKEYRFQHTSESVGGNSVHLPLIGMRYASDAVEWFSNVDTALYPEFRDHRVGDRVIFPGSAFVEMAVSAARQWLNVDDPVLTDFELLQPLDLSRDETFEMRTRVSPASNSLEISSRPRLSHAGWVTHVRCTLSHGHGRPPDVPVVANEERNFTRADMYGLASDGGLHYGPQFRLVDKVAIYHGDLIEVRLAPGDAESRFVLDPVRGDCCGHGIIAMFPELKAKERGVTYIPVRSDRISIYHPHAVPVRAILEVVSKTSRAIVGNYYILDSNDRLIAHFHRLRGQAIVTRQQASIATMAFVEVPWLLDGAIVGSTGVKANADDVFKTAASAKLLARSAEAPDRAAVAIENWARSSAYEIVRALADEDIVDPDRLIDDNRVPAQSRDWLRSLLSHLEAAGLARASDRSWKLGRDRPPRVSQAILKAICGKSPTRVAELTLAGWLSGLVSRIKSDRALKADHETCPPESALDLYRATNVLAAAGSNALFDLLSDCPRLWPEHRALRILSIGHGPLTRALAAPMEDRSVRLTVLEPNRRSFDRAQAAQVPSSRFELLGEDNLGELGAYDLIVSSHGLNRLPESIGPEILCEALAPGGLLVAIEAGPSLFADLVFGTQSHWFEESAADLAKGKLRDGREWDERLERAKSMALRGLLANASLIVAERGRGPRAVAEQDDDVAVRHAPREVAVVAEVGSIGVEFANTVLAELKKDIRAAPLATNLARVSDVSSNTTIVFAGASYGGSDPQEDLLRRCNGLKALVEGLGSTNATIWMIFSGALSVEAAKTQPVETGAWAFSRVLSNEYAKLDLRRIDVAPNTPPALAARHVRAIIHSGTAETELHSDGRAIRAVRVMRLGAVLETLPHAKAQAVRLARRAVPGQRVSWERMDRAKPKRAEVEIEVDSAGLNFRDLMWSLSLLPDEMLEDGFAGPALGLECSGRVVRVGSAVEGLRRGDRVLALAANCIASHVTVRANQVVKVPKGMTAAAAATIPVAFMTAYYSLVKLARLSAREIVLVHGAAGAVGMAAIQIAKWRGARVIATAGSTAKRSLLIGLGVDHVLDSRSTRFVEDVVAITGSGVDVVLNSLAGEAMEASIACLRPFGRFVELGKRDYIANTNIGLRPFRRNLSYFGVDLDQLMVGRRAQAKTIFRELIGLFERRILTPLPFSAFKGEDVAEAFQLMQESHHVGKIVVRPPALGTVAAGVEARPFKTTGTHVITGAFGGFGLEAAKWLVDQGVRSLALCGRRGAASPAARSMLEDFEKRGVKVMADPLDVSDRSAVEAAFDKIRRTMPPVVGVMHAAMVLDDAIVANLDDDRFRRVMAPKVQGAENLDAATRGLALDYFVLFSSITTIAGNHGQGNYVAANAYMEGLARNRRLSGLPALAIGWGVISDVGAAATNEKARKNLVKLATRKGISEDEAIGMMGMRARDALDMLARALAESREATDPAVMVISPSAGRFRKEFAAVLRSPTYKDFVSQQSGDEVSAIDLRALLINEDIEVVRRKVLKIVVDQLAKVLHARPEEISRVRPLRELGLDSLMTLELAMDLESSVGIDFSVARSVGSLTVPNLVDEIIAQVSSARDLNEQDTPGEPKAEAKADAAATKANQPMATRLVA